MTDDVTELIRREAVGAINHQPGSREDLESKHEQVWDSDQLRERFWVHSFLAPCVSVTRKSDGAKGTLFFQHSPRFYFDFKED